MEDYTWPRHEDPVHGYVYQLKLLMLFLHRGIRHKYNFKLRTETKAAFIFDDLVFEYNEGNRKFFRLLQAKHVFDETKKITVADLLASSRKKRSDQNYSLIKYFHSYMECKNGALFEGGSFKDLIVFTNIDFDIENLKIFGIEVHEVTEDDDILTINTLDEEEKPRAEDDDILKINTFDEEVKPRAKDDDILKINTLDAEIKPRRYKFGNSLANVLKDILEKDRDLLIAKVLADFILHNKLLHKNRFDKYSAALNTEIIDTVNHKLSKNFVSNNNLSSRASGFREMFEVEIKEQSNEIYDLSKLDKAIEEKKIELNIHPSIKRYPKPKGSPWPSKNIVEQDVLDFLKLITFSVKLNEDELGKAIEEEIGDQFNKITTEHIYRSLFQHMVDFLQNKTADAKGNKVELLSYETGKSFIEDASFEIIRLQLSGYRDYLDSIPCTFKQNVSEKFDDFINSEKTLWLLTSLTPRLSSLAIYKSIKYDTRVKKSFIYNCSDLLGSNGKILSDFKNLNNFVIIISCHQAIVSEDTTTEIVQKIKKAFFEPIVIFKKIIVVASEKHEIQRKLKQEFQDFYSQEFNIRFNDMDDTSQSLLLEKKNITFQGRHQLSLQKLLDIKDCDFKQQIDFLNLDAPSTELLLCCSQLEIFNQTNDFNSLTYKPTKTVTFDNIVREIKRNRDDIFAFHVDDENIELMFVNENINLIKLNVSDSLEQIKNYRFILLDLQREEMEFNFLCQIIHDYASEICKPSLHRLKYVGSNKWIWVQTFNINLYMSRHYVPNNFSRRILNTLSVENSFDFILFSGLVKKEFLKKVRIFCDSMYASTREANTKYNKIEHIFSNYRGHNFANNSNYTFAKPKQIAKRKFNLLSKILRDSQSYNPNDIFLPATKYHNKKSIHWLKIQTELDIYDNQTLLFEWQHSSGNTTTIMHRRNVWGNRIKKEYCKTEDNLVHLNKRLMLLSDGPGTGKSCTLTRIIQSLKKCKPTSLIIEINLNKLQRSSDSFCVKSKNQLIELLFKVLKQSSTYAIEKKIIEYKMEYPEQLILLFDGFDEMIKEKQESALSLFTFIIQKTRASMWITTRSHNEKELQNLLCVLKYSFKELDDEYKALYLRNFLLTSLKFSGKDSEYDFLLSLFGAIDHNIHSLFIGLTSVPLMLRFIAEKYIDVLIDIETRDISVASEKIKQIKLADVFESFVRHLYEIYFVEKMKIVEWIDSDSKGILQDAYSNACRCLAVRKKDNSFYVPKLSPDDTVKAFTESMKGNISLDTLSKIGLIKTYDSKKKSLSTENISESNNEQTNFYYSAAYGKVQFIHPALKIFFAVEFACYKLKTYPSLEILWEFLINNILLNTFSLEIFENKLAKDNELSSLSSEDRSKKIIFNLHLRQTKRPHARRVLWMAADLGFRKTVIFLSKCFLDSDNFSKALEEFFYLPKNYFGHIPNESVFVNYIMNANTEKYATNINLISDVVRKITGDKFVLQL